MPPRTVFIPTSEFKESQNKMFIPLSSGTAAGPVPAIPVAASPTISGLVAPVSDKQPASSNPLVPPVLGAETGRSNQAGAAVVPPTSVPAPTANSAPQAHNAPRPSVLWSHTDASHITFLLSPAAEVSFTVADAEKEWAHALRQAHETKVQLTKAQAAYDQAVATERLRFKAYSEARYKSDK